jgi:hypothetical protein
VSEIGRIDTTTDAIVEYPTPTSGANPEVIAAGPDGNMWFTEVYGIDQVGLINPTTRAITEIPLSILGEGDSHPVGLTAGVDGNMWLTESLEPFVTEIDVNSHALTDYPLPDSVYGAYQIAMGPDGNLWFIDATGNGAAIGEVSGSAVVQPLAATQTAVSSSANPSTVGQPVTFTAVVSPSGTAGTPSGNVTFTIDGVSTAPVPLHVVKGSDQATLSIPSLGEGRHTISAAYGGDSSFAASVLASQLVLTVKAVSVPAGDGPKVDLVQRFGVHMQPTVLVITFNEALDPASAVNLNNYKIADPAGRAVRIRSAVFDAATNTVTLRPAERVNLHHTYHLTLVGTGPDGIRNTQGALLDGADSGSADSDYTGTLTWRNVVLTPAEAKKIAHRSRPQPGGPLHHRFLHLSH